MIVARYERIAYHLFTNVTNPWSFLLSLFAAVFVPLAVAMIFGFWVTNRQMKQGYVFLPPLSEKVKQTIIVLVCGVIIIAVTVGFIVNGVK